MLQAELRRYLASAGPALQRDWRDVLVILAPYHDCAIRLGSDAVALFDQASVGMPESIRTTAMTFARRSDISLPAFGWVLTELPDGPCYESAEPMTFDDVRAAIRKMGGTLE